MERMESPVEEAEGNLSKSVEKVLCRERLAGGGVQSNKTRLNKDNDARLIGWRNVNAGTIGKREVQKKGACNCFIELFTHLSSNQERRKT